MSLFQKPPRTPEEIERSRPLDIAPPEVDLLDEHEWHRRAFRGDAAQLTVRAVALGSVLGFLLAFTNVYVGLKAGWGLGVALTACIASFTLWSALLKLGLVSSPMTILEANCMQSTASSAGYSTTTLLVSAIPAMLLLSVTDANPRGIQLRWYVVLPWVFCAGVLGVVMAIPMKRNMINRERLKFPSGTAAAVLLQSLYSKGTDALAKGRALMASSAIGALVPILTNLNAIPTHDPTGHGGRTSLVASQSRCFDWLPRLSSARLVRGTHLLTREPYPLSAANIVLDHSLVLVAAGAIVGVRTTLSMAAGGLLVVFVLGPLAMEWTWTNAAGHFVAAATGPGTAWKEIGIWFGAPLMVSHGLLSFGLQYKTIVRAVWGMWRGRAPTANDIGQRIEPPFAWFAYGTAIAGSAVVALASLAFDIPLHYGALAVLMTFFLALVACRATGETDVTPVGAMGKITQLTYGALIPQSYAANLMTASITAGASIGAADLLTDLKSGYLLGAHPRRQFVAQLAGVASGAISSVLCYFLLVPDATVLTGTAGHPPQFAAPAAQQWRAVAEVFELGIANLHPMAREGIAIGLVVGSVLAILEWAFPDKKRWMPSPAGIGLGLFLPFFTSLSFVLGALLAKIYGRLQPERADRFVVPVASGLIAGESILGVLVATLNNFVLK